MRGGGLPAGTKSRRVRGHGGQGAPPPELCRLSNPEALRTRSLRGFFFSYGGSTRHDWLNPWPFLVNEFPGPSPPPCSWGWGRKSPPIVGSLATSPHVARVTPLA